MLKKTLIAFAVATISLVLTTTAFAQPGRKRAKPKPSSATQSSANGNASPAQTSTGPSVTTSTGAGKKPSHFIGGADDGQSIRQKQPRGRHGKPSSATQSNASAAQTTAGPAVTTTTGLGKKPGHYIGGSDDGNSIRQKQPRGRHNKQSSAGPTNANPSAMNQQEIIIGQGVTAKPKQPPKVRRH